MEPSGGSHVQRIQIYSYPGWHERMKFRHSGPGKLVDSGSRVGLSQRGRLLETSGFADEPLWWMAEYLPGRPVGDSFSSSCWQDFQLSQLKLWTTFRPSDLWKILLVTSLGRKSIKKKYWGKKVIALKWIIGRKYVRYNIGGKTCIYNHKHLLIFFYLGVSLVLGIIYLNTLRTEE